MRRPAPRLIGFRPLSVFAMELFTKLFGNLLAFVYHCFDRIVTHGYLSALSRPEQVVYFFRQVLGVPVVSKEILSQRTADYQSWVEAFARNHRTPIVWAEKGVRKEDHVLAWQRRIAKNNAYITASTSFSKAWSRGRPSASVCRNIPPRTRTTARQRSRFTHYYFYIRSFFPFHTTYYLNGHSFIEQELNRAQIGFILDFPRNELCSNNLTDFGLKKGLDHLDAVRQTFQAISDRFAGFQAQWLNVHVDFPLLQRIALPVTIGSVRYPGIKIPDIRVIRLCEVLLHGGTHVGGWTANQIHEAVLTTFHLSDKGYGLNQLRYDLRKLRGHGLIERDGTRYAYRLTLKGVQVALLFLFFHKRLCGPLANSRFRHQPDAKHRPHASSKRLPPRRQGNQSNRRIAPTPAKRKRFPRRCRQTDGAS
jgi:hypothetical protein